MFDPNIAKSWRRAFALRQRRLSKNLFRQRFWREEKPRRVCARRRKEDGNHFLRRRVRRRKYRSARKRAKGVPFVRCSEPQPLSNESPVKRVSFESLPKPRFGQAHPAGETGGIDIRVPAWGPPHRPAPWVRLGRPIHPSVLTALPRRHRSGRHRPACAPWRRCGTRSPRPARWRRSHRG